MVPHMDMTRRTLPEPALNFVALIKWTPAQLLSELRVSCVIEPFRFCFSDHHVGRDCQSDGSSGGGVGKGSLRGLKHRLKSRQNFFPDVVDDLLPAFLGFRQSPPRRFGVVSNLSGIFRT